MNFSMIPSCSSKRESLAKVKNFRFPTVDLYYRLFKREGWRGYCKLITCSGYIRLVFYTRRRLIWNRIACRHLIEDGEILAFIFIFPFHCKNKESGLVSDFDK